MALNDWFPKLLGDPQQLGGNISFGVDARGQQNYVPGLLTDEASPPDEPTTLLGYPLSQVLSQNSYPGFSLTPLMPNSSSNSLDEILPSFLSSMPVSDSADSTVNTQNQALHQGGLLTKTYRSTADANMDGANQGPDVYQKLSDIIGGAEGSDSYEAYNTGTRKINGKDKVIHSYSNAPSGKLTNKTINDIVADGLCLTPENTDRTFASGKYQITAKNLQAARDAMRLTGDEKFTPEMQDRIFREYMLPVMTRGLNNYINYGMGTANNAQKAAAGTWAAIAPVGSTQSRYESGANHANQQSSQQLGSYLQSLWPR